MAGRYAEIVADRAARRRLAAGAMDAAGSAYDESKPLSEALAVLERLSSDEDPPISGAVDSKAGLEATLQEINSATGSAIATGFDCFDTSYGGLFGGELAILAAKTGGGKSAFSMQICESIARSRPVLIASLEMGSNEIHRRRLARHTGIELKKMRNGDLTDDERRILDVAVSDLETSRLHILDAANCGLPEIARESRRLKHREGGLGLIAVDYLQLLRSDADDSKSNRERQVAGLTRGLKCLARDLKVPVLCLCQLNRKADDADEPRPSHLRESGAIEQDADVVMFVHRENYQETEKTKLIVAKHRNGQSQSFPMRWDGPRFQFLESKWGGGQPFEADDFSFPASDNWSGTNFMDATSCE